MNSLRRKKKISPSSVPIAPPSWSGSAAPVMSLFSLSIILPLGILFLFSGVVVNAAQVLTCTLLLFSRPAYRRANRFLMELLWSELVWLMDWWAGVEIRIYGDPDAIKHIGKEHALVISNHRSDLDWLFGWVFAQRVGCLGSTRAVMKKVTQYLPVIGWSMWFSEYTFVKRNWSRDEAILKESFQRLKDFPQPFWLALFVEGTRFTEAKLQAAQEYAISSGLPKPRNVLIPKTKGFVSAVTNMRDFVPAVYDITVAVPKESPPPTMKRLLSGQPFTVHLHVRRCLMSDLPLSEDGLAQWCRDSFISKDDLLDKYKSKNTFGEDLYYPIPRPIKPLLIVVSWASLLMYVAGRLLRPLLSSWVGVAWVTGGLGTVFLVMQIFIISTQSERSTPAQSRTSNHKVNGKQ